MFSQRAWQNKSYVVLITWAHRILGYLSKHDSVRWRKEILPMPYNALKMVTFEKLSGRKAKGVILLTKIGILSDIFQGRPRYYSNILVYWHLFEPQNQIYVIFWTFCVFSWEKSVSLLYMCIFFSTLSSLLKPEPL